MRISKIFSFNIKLQPIEQQKDSIFLFCGKYENIKFFIEITNHFSIMAYEFFHQV